MSLFRSKKIQDIRLCNPLFGWIRGMIGVGVAFITWQSSAQFSPDIAQQLNNAIVAGDFHMVSLAISGCESRARSAPDNQKMPFLKDALHFAAAILAKCDPSLHSAFGIGPEPPFDWQKYGIRPLFNGVSPDAIEDSVAREAYKSALADHRKLMVRLSAERQKLEEADYCARAAFRVVESVEDRKALNQAIGKHIASIQEAQWIRDRLIQIVLPQPPSKELSPPQNESNAKASTLQHQPSAPKSPLLSAPQPVARNVPDAKPVSSPIETPASSTPWSFIVVLIVAACGLLWLLLKRRS